ncbi:tripartite motif-containing protein 3-like [Anneissia japonica]|uniref:tripartite motif-containing protein 3-like n=1 Tax=Anneissia japonica TaxID=1529436 RepID=UPI001425B5CE|nr:tripartite motif-containing protein 3-like [Anneissia japonica]
MAEGKISQLLNNLDEKVMECAICLKRLQKPTTLACLHTFCLSCLQDWVKQKDALICPTCSQPYTIPKGGLQKLPPNTFINNLLESIEQLEKEDKTKCLCGKYYAQFYCQDCRNHLCSSCKDQHKIFPQLRDHVIHSIEDVKSMTPLELSSLNSPRCSLHKDKTLEFYCKVCVTPICTNCAITEHNEHKPVDITDAFNEFKEITVHLKQNVEEFKANLQTRREHFQLNALKLEENNKKCRSDINAFVEEIKNTVTEMEERLFKELHELHAKKKKIFNGELDGLDRIACDVDTRWNYISQLLKSNKATALQSHKKAVAVLQDRIKALPAIELKDKGEIYFLKERESFSKFKQNGIGCVVENALDYFKISSTAILGKHHNNGDCVVTGMCLCAGDWNLNVSLGEHPIKGSPLIINVEKERLQSTHNLRKNVMSVVMANDGYLLVSCKSNEIFKLKESSVRSTIKLPEGVSVHRMKTLKTNGNIVFGDTGNKCITVCKPEGQVIKSFGKGLIGIPYGVDVNENTNEVYVADYVNGCVLVLSLENGQLIKRIGSKRKCEGQLSAVYDVTLTKEGHVIVADTFNNRIQMFDRDGSFIRVLVQGDDDSKVKRPLGVVMDEEEHLIVASYQKLQLFTKTGKFIKTIGQKQDGIEIPEGLCVVSHYPRRVAVANWNRKNVLIFNY